MAVLLGLLVAVAYGTGDFFGGRAAKPTSALSVLVVSQACGVAAAAALVVVTVGDPTRSDLGFGAVAGAINVVGLGLLYHALARYTIGVVAPVTAVVGAVVPVTWGLVEGERPSALVWGGVLLAILAGGFIAREPGEGSRGWAAGASVAALAGFALGASFVLFAETTDDSGMWPVLAARSSAAALVWVLAAVLAVQRRPTSLPNGDARALAIAAGLLDVAATALLLLAVRRGLIVVVAPIASLAPGFTVLLAWIVLGERLGPTQRFGIACALAGLLLVSVG